MKTTFAYLILVLVLTNSVSCDAGEPVAPELVQLYGSWEWVKSFGGYAGQTRTPESTSETAKVVFLANIVQFYRNNTLFSQSRFGMAKEPFPSSQAGFTIEFYDFQSPSNRQFVSFRGPDTLILSDLCMDCYQHTYSRVRD
jgi:hypothetical protein